MVGLHLATVLSVREKESERGDEKAILRALKEKVLHTKLSWATLVPVSLVEDGMLCIGWTNNNAVLMLTTVHSISEESDLVIRLRKQPSATSSNPPRLEGHFPATRGCRCQFPAFSTITTPK